MKQPSGARQAADKALNLNPQLAEAHAAQALVKLFFDWDWEGAEQAYRRALALHPGDGQLLHHFGHYFDFRKRSDDAQEAFDRAQSLDPVSAFHHNGEAMSLVLEGRWDAADALLAKVRSLNPELPLYWYTLGMLREKQGRLDEAIAAWEQALELSDSRFLISALGYGYARAGRIDEAQAIIQRLRNSLPAESQALELAKIYAGLGEVDRAFAELKQAIDHRDPWIVGVVVDVGFDPLVDDPRYDGLLNRVYAGGAG